MSELASLVLSRGRAAQYLTILAPRLGNAQTFGLAFLSLYVANKNTSTFQHSIECWNVEKKLKMIKKLELEYKILYFAQ
jgi:hypothetical protein